MATHNPTRNLRSNSKRNQAQQPANGQANPSLLGQADVLLDRQVREYMEVVTWCEEYLSLLKEEVEARRKQLQLDLGVQLQRGGETATPLQGLLLFLSQNARQPRGAGQGDVGGEAEADFFEEYVLRMLSDQKKAAEEELEELKKSVEGVQELLGTFERLQGDSQGAMGIAALLNAHPPQPRKVAHSRERGKGGREGAEQARRAPVPSLERAIKARVKEVLLGLCKLHRFQRPKFSVGQREVVQFMFRPQNKQLVDVALVHSTSLMQLLEQDAGLNEEWISREYVSVCMDVTRDRDRLAKHRLRIAPGGTNGGTERLQYLLGWQAPSQPPSQTTPTTSADPPESPNAPPRPGPSCPLPSPLPPLRPNAPSSQLPGMSGSGSIHHEPCTPSDRRQTRSATRGDPSLLFSSSLPPPSRSKGKTPSNLDHSLGSAGFGSPATVQGKGPSLAAGGLESPGDPPNTHVGGTGRKGAAGRPRRHIPPPEGKEGYNQVWVDTSQLIASIRHAEFPTQEDTEKTKRVACHEGGCQGKNKICCNPAHIRFRSKRVDVWQREDFRLYKKQNVGFSRDATFLSNVSFGPRSPASDAGSQIKDRRRKAPSGRVRGPRGPPVSERHKIRDQAFFNMKNGALGSSFQNLRQHPENPAALEAADVINFWSKGIWGAKVQAEEVEEAQASPPHPPTRLPRPPLRAPPRAVAPSRVVAPPPAAATAPLLATDPPLATCGTAPLPTAAVAPPVVPFVCHSFSHTDKVFQVWLFLCGL